MEKSDEIEPLCPCSIFLTRPDIDPFPPRAPTRIPPSSVHPRNPDTPWDVVNTAKCKLVIALLADGQEEEAKKISSEDPPQPPKSRPPEPEDETVDPSGHNGHCSPSVEDEASPNATNGLALASAPVTPVDLSSRPKKKDKPKDKKSRGKTKAKGGKNEDAWHCSYCNVLCPSKPAFETHKRSDQHQQVIMSDEGRTWKFRPPPRGMGAESYTLCSQFGLEGACRFGIQCVAGHSKEELREWKERFEYRQKKALKATKMYGKSFVETVIEKWSSAKNPSMILANKLDGLECSCDRNLNQTVESKPSKVTWTFQLSSSSQKSLRNFGFLIDVTRGQFSLKSIKHLQWTIGEDEEQSDAECVLRTIYDKEHDGTTDVEEWSAANNPSLVNVASNVKSVYVIQVEFHADIFGKFQQSVVFSFGTEPFLKQDICVDVVAAPSQESSEDPEEDGLQKFQQSIISQPERWDEHNSEIVDFDPPLIKPEADDELILRTYPHPQPSKFQATNNVKDPGLTKNNYVGRMHELLFIEEMAQFEQLSEFNVVTKLELTTNYLLMPTSTNSSTAKYARQGELFGQMALGSSLSEDTPAGRLILTNCNTLLLSKPGPGAGRRTAYTSAIEDSGKDTLYLRMSTKMVSEFNLENGGTVEVEVQFQLNRVPLCEMHLAVDKLPDINYIYPDVRGKSHLPVPWSPAKQWAEDMTSELNAKQKEAIMAITSCLTVPTPPILIIGPYGTGKTYTLGHAIKLLLKQENAPADLYIRDYLHPFIEENSGVKLVRVYYRHRWVQTVHNVVQKYCLINHSETARVFRNPSLEDVQDANIVVATLSTSRYLNGIGLVPGHFTHILVDEAAQAMECEALMPLGLALPETRVVLAGDHMQLSPEVFSQFAKAKNFNKSLLERLYDLYPMNFPYKVLLCENYRSHEAIINYTSSLFYDQKLVASGKQTTHDKWYPLTVFTARGEAIQDANSTSFYNNSEVYEVVDRVAELQKTWPKSWGHRDESSIGIVTPYYDQVQRIRSELRKRKLFGVSVERVLNVQGKQFRAIFLSTVRTRSTCIKSYDDPDECDFGFLSNAKLLNTAITRAQSLVAVVGDPIALCSVGKCRKLWEKFLEISSQNQSLMGMKWFELRGMLDRVELKKTYVLNPFAPEFIPGHRRHRESFLSSVNNSNVTTVHGHVGHPPGLASNPLVRFTPHKPVMYGPVMYPNHGPPPPGHRGFPPLPAQGPFIPVPPPLSPMMKISLPNTPTFYPSPLTTQPPPLHHQVRAFYSQQAMVAALMAGKIPPHRQAPPPPFPLRPPLSPSKRTHNPMALQNGVHPGSQAPNLGFGPPPAQARMPNPQFANSKYQRQSGSSAMASPTPMGFVGSPSGFMGSTANNGAIPKPPHPHHPREELEHPGMMGRVRFDPPPPGFVEAACSLLPNDLDVRPFLSSAQMKTAWFTMLHTRSPAEAKKFTEMVGILEQRPEFIDAINCVRQRRPAGHPDPFRHRTNSAIHVQDLEALSFREAPIPMDPFVCRLGPTPSASQGPLPLEDPDDEEIARLLQRDLVLSGILNDNSTSEAAISNIFSTPLEEDQPVIDVSTNTRLYQRRPVELEDDPLQLLGAVAHLDPPQGPALLTNSPPNEDDPEGSGAGGASKTYANVLRASQAPNEDPLTRIRNLGTQGNRESDNNAQSFFNFGAPWSQFKFK
eukprot:maker-scaffold62_size438377-snap-gene-2.15 protein:Tk07852 transcript:maker-scaffold62_size438377-snap-gene-2.15-mRNA-1 annotation:"helicase with zinc finger protein domain"